MLAGRVGTLVIGLVAILNIYLAIHAIRHLPFIDFRAYKAGASIPAGMEPSEPLRHMYIMEKDGEEFEFEDYPTDTTYKYLDIKLLNPEAQPVITDYSVWDPDGDDVTDQTFVGNWLVIVVHYTEKTNTNVFQRINDLIDELDGDVQVMALTASNTEAFETFRHHVQLAVPYYFADATVLKTMIRSNPGILLLSDGVVMDKWHFRDVPSSQDVIQLTY